jgi:alkylation response protein AidB-like acyl-CoA dehydrogenase
MVTGLVPGAIRTLLNFGSDAQKDRFLPSLASGKTIATMCLTEASAGSDLSRISCRAVPDGARWRIVGEKIFISGGDQDISDEILHLVLARTSDNGVKGLSLFLCPSTKTDGTRNAVKVTRIEEKMGLHASPTCQMLFDSAEAELIGEEGRGLAAMFTMMNHARGDVALQGVGHAARAHHIASANATDRVQGRLADGTPARLDQHADVRRMLDAMDRYALFGRAMTHMAFVAMERGDKDALVEFLTPLIKVFCTEAGMRSAELGIQVLGGYGFLREYRIEQTYRDARITAIYEGANGIHKRMLATRMVQGSSANAFEQMLIEEGIDIDVLGQWQSIRADTMKHADPAAMAHRYMQASIDAMQAVVHKRMALCVDAHPDPDRIRRILALDSELWSGM